MYRQALRRKEIRKQKYFHLMILMGMIYLFIFVYIPLFGIIIAFKDYRIVSGISGMFTSDWVGSKYFVEFFTDYQFSQIIRNTLAIIFLQLFFVFPVPILFAILLNEVKSVPFKRVVQTVSYLPHFISWVVVYGIAVALFAENGGLFNDLFVLLGLLEKPKAILTDPDAFWTVSVLSAVWKEMGWNAIIFLAAIAGINPALYEAADVDGASRIAKIKHITLPSLKSAIVIVLILKVGYLFKGGAFEQCFLFGNRMNNGASEIIPTYAFRVGLVNGRYAFATAVDLLQSSVAIVVVYLINFISKKLTDSSLF
ncbi:sugar ABC transporter permease [Oceanispirochaeta sp. M2]|nr:sugar ABC transporter permease [Oceanispirochaeta sp. M2]NPD72967.1 sugar ABC transporter permease [Oceanispirochaeta sp. M1]RDG31418.1 sugar ABC transporter permease [Oceanispirochaeta sp. M1]